MLKCSRGTAGLHACSCPGVPLVRTAGYLVPGIKSTRQPGDAIFPTMPGAKFGLHASHVQRSPLQLEGRRGGTTGISTSAWCRRGGES